MAAHRGRQAFGRGKVDVGADEVDQCEGAEAVSCRHHRGVDFGGGAAFFEKGQRFAVKGTGAAVHDEAGAVPAGNDGLACAFGQATGKVQRVGRAVWRGDQFDQLHHRCGIEEMQAHHAFGPGQPVGNGCDG